MTNGPIALSYGCPEGTVVDHEPTFPIAVGSRRETAGCAECRLDPADRTGRHQGGTGP